MVEMSQARDLIDVHYEQVGPDMPISGFLQPIPDLKPVIPSVDETSAIDPTVTPHATSIIFFNKAWDPFGAFSNFSPHPIQMPDENGDYATWLSVEHYYQAQKFSGVNDPIAQECVKQIRLSKSTEEAAQMGRRIQRQHHDLVALLKNSCTLAPKKLKHSMTAEKANFVTSLLIGNPNEHVVLAVIWLRYESCMLW